MDDADCWVYNAASSPDLLFVLSTSSHASDGAVAVTIAIATNRAQGATSSSKDRLLYYENAYDVTFLSRFLHHLLRNVLPVLLHDILCSPTGILRDAFLLHDFHR